jgi:hypothetical protein
VCHYLKPAFAGPAAVVFFGRAWTLELLQMAIDNICALSYSATVIAIRRKKSVSAARIAKYAQQPEGEESSSRMGTAFRGSVRSV